MKTTKRDGTGCRGVVVTIAVLALAGSATPVAGQSAAAGPDIDAQRAELLALHGDQLARLQRDFGSASSYLLEAAELRGDGAAKVGELMKAGYFAYYAGRELSAVSAFRRAGHVALATGDVEAASRAFYDAAWVADREGEVAMARELFDLSRRPTQIVSRN